MINKSRSNRRIKNLLYRDELTGLDNLNRFYDSARELLRTGAAGHYAVLYCDIDRFKLINDTFGFEEGDEVLCTLGRILQQSVQEQECCARISADNFVMLADYRQWDILTARLERIHAELNQWSRVEAAGPHNSSGGSGGNGLRFSATMKYPVSVSALVE